MKSYKYWTQQKNSHGILDLSAAFYTVNQTILNTVIEHYFSLKDTALLWLNSDLFDRQFLVQIGSSFWQTHTINFSVPQESIFGPVLFSCYVSTLPEVIKLNTDTTILGYADDYIFTKDFIQKETLVKQTIEEKVDRRKNWMWMNQLQMNDTKMEFSTFDTSSLLSKIDLDSITIREITVNCSKMVKFLGGILDEIFSFRQHVVAQAKLAVNRIHLIKIIRKYLTINNHQNDYVCPHTTQIGLYQLSSTKHITQHHQTLTKSPELSCPNCLQKAKWTSITSCMELLQWPLIRYGCFFKLLTIVYETLHVIGPTYLTNRLKMKDNTTI